MRRIVVFFWILSGVSFGMLFGALLATSSPDMVRPVASVGIGLTFASLIFAELSNFIYEWLEARRSAKKGVVPA